MHILQFISSGGFFGAENVILQLAQELQNKVDCSNSVGIFENLHTPHRQIAEEFRRNGIEAVTFRCRGKFDLKTVWYLRRFIQKRKINIIHSHGYKSNLYSFFASRGLSTSMVTTCHNWLGSSAKMKFYARLDKSFLKKFDKVIAVSDTVKREILYSNIPPHKVITISNGIDINRFGRNVYGDSIRKEFGIDRDFKVIGTVGRLSEEKGHGFLLAAAEKIQQQCPKVAFLIVGDGPLMDDLRKKPDKSRVIFTGIRNDTPQIYSAMDIFVLPSLTEGLPMVLLEAMASKKPVVATKVGDVPRVLKDGETGLLIEPGSTGELADAILYLIQNEQKGKEIAERGYERVKAEFSSKIMAQRYVEVYNEVLGVPED